MNHDKNNDRKLTSCTELMRLTVCTEEGGALLGRVTQIICDRTDKAISAIGFRENIFKEEYIVPIKAVRKIGRDLLVIDRESSIQEFPKKLADVQFTLRSFIGTPITSLAGNSLGKLSDISVDANWKFGRLFFDSHHWLEITADSLTIGHDQIMVPAGSTDKVIETKADASWTLSRAFEKHTFEQIGETLQKSFRRKNSGKQAGNIDKSETLGDGL